MEKKIRVAVIAAGNRSCAVVRNLLKDSNRNVEIASVYDPDPAQMEYALSPEFWDSPNAKRCKTSLEAIQTQGVDWVMIFSPNAFHKQHILEAFAAGKPVFTEKPLATSIEDCREIYDAYKKSGLLFATGFVLRYGSIYRKAKALLDSGRFGRIHAIEANENIRPGHGGYIMCNWRRHTNLAGPHILEKCCHDLDLINWYCGSLPIRVSAFGGREFFRPENRGLEKKYGAETFHVWRDPHRIDTPFTDDSDLMDTLVSIAEFRNRIRVTFTATMSNAIPERRLLFHCSEGTVDLDLYQQRIRYKNLADEGITEVKFDGDGHGGGDSLIMVELYNTMVTGSEPACSGSEGLESAIYALAVDQAARTGEIVNLEFVWRSLDRLK